MSGNVSNHIWVEDNTKPLGGYWARARGLSTGAALVSDALLDPSGTVTLGNVLAPTTATELNIITGASATQLIMRYKGINDAVTNNPGIYYVLNAVDPTVALASKTTCHFLALGDEAIHTFPADDPLTSVDIEPVGTVANTILAWEYK